MADSLPFIKNKVKIPFHTMCIGDSLILYPDLDKTTKALRAYIFSSFNYFKSRNTNVDDWHIRTSVENNEGVDYVVVTRIKKSTKANKTKNQEKYIVEKDFVLPKRNLSSSTCKYPFSKMNVGDSFRIDTREFKNTRSVIGSVHSTFSNFKKIEPPMYETWKITTRTVDEDGICYLRVWRIQ